jgi:hypothetical protein
LSVFSIKKLSRNEALTLKTSVGALVLVAAAGASAAPITVNLSAWYLEHIGANSIGFSGGVEAVRSIAFADTSPDGSAFGRSTATITQGGATAPIDNDPSPLSRGFIRAQVNPAGAEAIEASARMRCMGCGRA